MAETLSLEDFGKMHGYDREEKFSQQKNSPATAPYNFVALPEKILPAPVEDVESYKKQIQSAENFSGEIEFEIENLTPLFIGGNGEKTFAPVKEIIPGSSLRGMFKNIFKIVTCGAFRGRTSTQKKGEDFNDEHIYFRCLMTSKNLPAWTKELNDLYNKRMTGKNKEGKPVKNARSGFLIQTTDGKFFIVPLKSGISLKNDFIMIKVFQKNFRPIKFKDSCIEWDFADGKAYILTGNQWEKRPEKLLTLEQYQNYKKSLKGLTAEEIAKKNRELNYGKQIIRFIKIDYADWSKSHWLELPDEVRESYEHDRNRKGVNLFKDRGILEREKIFELAPNAPQEIKTLVPCHFLEKDGEVTAFGHGQCFRIPYKNSVGKAVEKNLQSDVIDFADAIFGRENFWASRVFFEDAKIISESKTLPTAAAHPLMQPNPTSYQLYLKQDEKNSLKHWDIENAKIRGYKLYWHDEIGNIKWQASKQEIEEDMKKPSDKKILKPITPLKEGNKFKSKIRFENLSKIELGALLMIFDLNGAKNSAYKIGMGKSLGLGSVKIFPKLFLESETAYTELFDGDIFKNPCREENFSEYLDAFKNYVEKCGLKNIWEKVMGELNLILDWDNIQKNNWHEKIKSMSGNVSEKDGVDIKFKNRVPLPTIFEVVK